MKKHFFNNILITLFISLLPVISISQTIELKKGYSKADYIAAQEAPQNINTILQEQQQDKVLFPEPVEEKCGFMYVEKALQKMYPNRRSTQEFEQWMQQKIAKGEYDASRAVKTIPVVVHVIHNGEAVGTGPNITAEQVESQMVVLNEDFRRLNADADNTPDDFLGVTADAELEFCLATVTPDGTPFDGINRYDGGQTSYSVANMETIIKPATIWNPDYYFNIWVCNLQTYLGYAQFPDDSGLPGLPPDIDQDGTENTDGVVILHTAFGTVGTASSGDYNLGRTTTHEAGHFFGLRHIWGDKGDDNLLSCNDDDYCDDTPYQYSANYTGSPCTYPGPNSCFSGDPGDLPDQFMNFMDYSDDICMNMFSADQKTRIDVVISNSPRRNFELSQVCNDIPPPSTDPPVNDLCENALPISCDETVEGSTVYASFDDVGFCGTSNTAPGIWYTFVAPSDVYFVNLSTCNQANYDTKITVFTGSCESLICVDGRDDAVGCSDFTTDLTVNTIPGETYFVLVHGFGAATGTFDLTMTCIISPENTICENAIPISCDESVEGTTINATIDNVDFCGTSNTAPGVWYTFVAPSDAANLSTCDQANFDTKISVFTGTCESLVCVDGQDDDFVNCTGFTTNLTVNTIPGETYFVLVHGFGAATGDFTLTLTCLPIIDLGPDIEICEGETVILDAENPGCEYLWSTGETTQTIEVSIDGLYWVWVSNAAGTVWDDIYVTVYPEIPCDIIVSPQPPFQFMTGNILSAVDDPSIVGWTCSNPDWEITSDPTLATIEYTAGVGTTIFTVTYDNGCIWTCSTEPITSIESWEYCTLTQGFYGNDGGLFCDEFSTTELINSLLQSELVIGVSGRSLTVGIEESDFVFMMLPGGGRSDILKADYNFDNYLTQKPFIYKKNNYTLKNDLLAQTLTLGLNLGLDEDLGNFVMLTPYLTTAQSSGCGMTDTHPINELWRYNEIPSSVYNYLVDNFSPEYPTVQDLYILANSALTGDDVGGLSLGDITEALEAINDGFDECMFGTFEGNYWPPESLKASRADSYDPIEVGEVNHAIFPNPVNSTTIIEFALPESSNVRVEIYSINGSLVKTLYSGFVEENNTKTISLNVNNYPSGIYIYTIHTDYGSFYGKMVKNY